MSIAHQIVAALKAVDAPPVYGFVNGIALKNEPASAEALDVWTAAGFRLGNHTWSHLNLGKSTPEVFEAEVAANEPILQQRGPHTDWKWLRFPFLAEGETPAKRAEVRGWLASRGYHVASVTMSFDDWAFTEPYARCMARQDTAAIADLENIYMKWADAALSYSMQLSAQALDRQIPLVLLLHEGAFTARMLPRLLAFYQSRGAHFLGLAAAERDRFYASDYRTGPSPAPLSLELAARAKNIPLPHRASNPAELAKVCS